eukprot:1178268-Prorocentrum_minimum.AAC.2
MQSFRQIQACVVDSPTRPHANLPQPPVNSPQPPVNSPQPPVNSPQPLVNSPQPLVNSPQPLVNSPQPLVNSPSQHAGRLVVVMLRSYVGFGFFPQEAESFRPNAYIYNALISACERGGRWEQALEVRRHPAPTTSTPPQRQCCT